ncbi:MAG: hypothetical protein ABIH20_01825 [Candidatus Diapherotrites archaeon]
MSLPCLNNFEEQLNDQNLFLNCTILSEIYDPFIWLTFILGITFAVCAWFEKLERNKSKIA